MLIYCLTSSYPRDHSDAAGRFVAQHAELLRTGGHDVQVFSLRGTSDDAVRHVNWVPRRWSIFEASGAPDALEREPWRIWEGPVAVAALVRAATALPAPDLFLGHWLLPGGLAARISGRITGRPSAVIAHSGGVHMLRSIPAFQRPLSGWLLDPRTTAFSSRALRAKAKCPGGVVAPMGFSPVADEGSGGGLLCMGRLVPIKGFDVAVAVAAALERTLHVAGDGPERGHLTDRAFAVGADVQFHGFVEDAQKPAVFARCRTALFPSRMLDSGRHEGRPVSILEVSSAGVVPVVGDWPGAQEVVVDPSLQIVRRPTVSAWADAVRRVESAGLAEKTKAFARSQSWESLRERHLGFVEGAIR